MDKFLLNSLAVECPELCLDWHPIKNLPITISSISFGSAKKVWWKCHVCEHEWEAYISNRRKQYKYLHQKGTNCPNCIGRVFNINNSFAAFNPELVKEWHPTKNTITPDQISKTTKVKFWWICSICHNEWKTSATARSSGAGCPLCSKFLNKNIVKIKTKG